MSCAGFASGARRRPGHPELGHTVGVETTTGPLGQGVGNAVGMAIAQKMAAARYGDALCAGRVFGICSDGDVMEGVSHEAASLAGHLGLGDLILVYDDNHITIEGDTALAFSEDVGSASRRTAGTCRRSTATTTRRSRPRLPPRSPRPGGRR
jgi:transketolase